jgi:hypothetical protein
MKDGLLYRGTKKCVMDEQKNNVMEAIHSGPLGGHLGITKCYAKLSTRFYWPNMFEDLREFIGEKISR